MISSLLLPLLVAASPMPQADVAVVCPRAFLPALRPWVAHRAGQGHRIEMIAAEQSAEDIRAAIRDLSKREHLKYVLLIGDSRPTEDQPRSAWGRCVPTYYSKAEVNVRWGSEAEIATDNYYADLDSDRIPELAIGRLTADSPEELGRMVGKILAYENSSDFGPWRRQVNIVAGVGGFGAITDGVVEMAARRLIADGLPAAYRTTMTQASWRSPFCPLPSDFCDTTLSRLNEGCLFWVYMGHGHPHGLATVDVPGARHRILETGDLERLQCKSGHPIAFIMACYTGAFDARRDCLAEEMLRHPQGPVAVLSGSRVTMPYGMSVLGTGMLSECFEKQCPLLGDLVLRAKQQLGKREAGDARRATLDLIASVISPAADQLAAERLEHIELFNLIGDPLLRLRHPQQVDLEVPAEFVAGKPVVIKGKSPLQGEMIVELLSRRDRLTFEPQRRNKYDRSPRGQADFSGTYQQANDRRWATTRQTVDRGAFRLKLQVPQGAGGRAYVRCYIEGAEDFAAGGREVMLLPPATR